VIASILMGRYHFQHAPWQSVSDEGVEFVKACLELDYTKRSSVGDLLKHSWLMNNKLFIPSIASNGAKALVSSTNRHLHELQESNTTHFSSTGMRNASMLAVAFTMPLGKVKQLRDLFQEMDRNGNGVVGNLFFSLQFFLSLIFL
jgi:serine/threonine protein kinase